MNPGIQTLLEDHLDWVRGQRVGVLSHQAAVLRDGTSVPEALRRAGVNVVALFGPEHGYDGIAGAGERTHSRRHPAWGIPVYSLYGRARAPLPHMLRKVDVIVHDLQDLGVRPYTYLSTLHLLLKTCAAADKGVIVADRSVPLPCVLDGPVTQPDCTSFVAAVPVPFVYGMTPAESALWMQRTLIPDAQLRVAPMQGYARDDERDAHALPWIPPSPGIPTWESARTYTATVFSEALPRIDCGRMSGLSFQLVGAPWIRAEALADGMHARTLPGVRFHPHTYLPRSGPYAGRPMRGVRLTVTDPVRFRPIALSVHLLEELTRMGGARRVWSSAGVRHRWFDALYGTCAVRTALRNGVPAEEIVAGWRPELAAFRRRRRPCLLYAAADAGSSA